MSREEKEEQDTEREFLREEFKDLNEYDSRYNYGWTSVESDSDSYSDSDFETDSECDSMEEKVFPYDDISKIHIIGTHHYGTKKLNTKKKVPTNTKLPLVSKKYST